MTPRRRPPRPAALSFAAALAVAVVGGCDSSPPDDASCASIGVPEVGAVSATTPDGEFRTACANVTSGGGLLVAVAREPGSGALGGATIELYVEATEPGTYAFGEAGATGAAYGPAPGATVAAREGSVTVASFEGGLRGTFAFVTVTGAEVTDGRFDLDL